MTRTPPPDEGFTLIEVIAALLVLGFVLAGLAQATRFGMNAWSLETRLADHASELERVDRTLRLLIEQACAPVGGDDKPFAGQEHRMVFITTLPAEPATDPIRRAQVALGVDDAHHLVLRWQPQPNAVLIGNKPEQHEIILADGLERIDLAYRQAGADGGKWSKTWTDGNLPALVQIHFVLSNKKHKWPDIAVATMLDSNGSF
jgi:general secretion pathway protein J